jgi:hypothetical protein
MTRFVYLTDTHIGARELGYQQQHRYADNLPELINNLDAWIQQNEIDFVLHGGDMVDQVSIESIRCAMSIFSLSVPVYLCLGNHDMTHPEAAEIWLREAPDFFLDNKLQYDIITPDVFIHVVPNHWVEKAYYWDGYTQHPHFSPEQDNRWRGAVLAAGEKTLILCTHNEVAAVSPVQTGFTEPYHVPEPSFTQHIRKWIKQTPSLRCVLSGHNHINTSNTLDTSATRAVTASAFSEVPFEFKVLDITSNQLSMRTVSMMNACNFAVTYNFDKTFVQGRLIDRAFELPLCRSDAGEPYDA